MILVDLNQVVISNLMVQINNYKQEAEEGLVKHMILNSILSIKKKFGNDYGNIVLCCDNKNFWRKDIFPHYKASRKKARAESNHNWTAIFEVLNKIRDEIKEYFPYKVIEVHGAEADDVISTLCKNKGPMDRILILSGDKDFIQLQKYPGVTQYNPITKRPVSHEDPWRYAKEHVMRGDKSDGIPNFLSDDDTFVTDKRSKKILKTKLEAWKNLCPTEFCDEKMYRGWKRNEQLVDLGHTPADIKQKIVDQYDTYEYNQRDKLLNYFVKNKLRNLTEHIGDF